MAQEPNVSPDQEVIDTGAQLIPDKDDTPITPQNPQQSDGDDNNAGDDIAAKYENEKKSWAGKIQKLQTELNEAKNYKDYAAVYKALDEGARKNPEFRKLANKILVEQGIVDSSVIESDEEGVTGKEPEKTSRNETPNQQMDPQVQNWVIQKQQQELMENQKFIERFESDKPELQEGDDAELAQRRQTIGVVANLLQSQGASKEEAFERAYVQVFHPEKLSEQGELNGLLRSQSTNINIGGGYSSGKQTKKTTLTDEQKAAARAFGMSDEEYLEGLNL